MRVLEYLTRLFCSRFGCWPEDVQMDAALDELNIAPHERREMALLLEELYGVELDDATVASFVTVEDVVARVEDALNGQEEDA